MMSYQIRMFGQRVSASNTMELVQKLSEVNGSVSVIHDRGQAECKKVVFVDVADGVIRQSYGKHQVLKAADFEVGGLAYQ
jgi:hypothetical protein